jgi:transcriptional regulator with XRE-family HTH domain
MIVYASDPEALLRAVGERARQLRLLRKLQQVELAERAGVGVATVHRFETLGMVSMENALKIAMALHAEAAFEKLFEAPAYASLEEALARPDVIKRRRVSRRK